MRVLRQYQLEIIFLFFSFAAYLWSVLLLIRHFGIDPHRFEWLVAGPIILIYILALWHIRAKINYHDVRRPTGKTVFYWSALGVLLFVSYGNPLPATDYWSLEIMFIVFSLFLADSYWDFRRLTWRGIFSKKELE